MQAVASVFTAIDMTIMIAGLAHLVFSSGKTV